MSGSEKMRVVQVGVGGFGGHRRGQMRKTGLFDLVAAYDLNEEALKKAQAEDGAAPVESYEALLATPDIEAVIISTGAKFHAEQTLAALDKGLHVFVEKPLCSTMEETQAIVEAVKKTGLVVGMGHGDHSSDAGSRTIKKMIDGGGFGNVTAFEKTTCHSGGLFIKPGDWRGDPAKNPGGMLFQCGVHGLHELMYYFGPIRRVAAMMRYDVHTTGTADAAICMLEFASGLIGNLNAYHVCGYRHTLNIFGTQRNVYINHRYFDEGSSYLVQEEKLDGQKEPMTPLALEGESDETGNLRSFYKAVREGGTPYPSHLDGARAVAAVFAAEESANNGGRPVDVPVFE